MSKYERYQKKTETYIFPHKHCKKCGEMISESLSFCSQCYQSLKEKKKRRLFKRRKKKS